MESLSAMNPEVKQKINLAWKVIITIVAVALIVGVIFILFKLHGIPPTPTPLTTTTTTALTNSTTEAVNTSMEDVTSKMENVTSTTKAVNQTVGTAAAAAAAATTTTTTTKTNSTKKSVVTKPTTKSIPATTAKPFEKVHLPRSIKEININSFKEYLNKSMNATINPNEDFYAYARGIANNSENNREKILTKIQSFFKNELDKETKSDIDAVKIAKKTYQACNKMYKDDSHVVYYTKEQQADVDIVINEFKKIVPVDMKKCGHNLEYENISLNDTQIAEAIEFLARIGEFFNIEVEYIDKSMHKKSNLPSAYYLIIKQADKFCNFNNEEIKHIIRNYEVTYENSICNATSSTMISLIENNVIKIQQEFANQLCGGGVATTTAKKFTKMNLSQQRTTPEDQIDMKKFEFLNATEATKKYNFMNFSSFINALLLTNPNMDEKIKEEIRMNSFEFVIEKSFMESIQKLIQMNKNLTYYFYLHLLSSFPTKTQIYLNEIAPKEVENLCFLKTAELYPVALNHIFVTKFVDSTSLNKKQETAEFIFNRIMNRLMEIISPRNYFKLVADNKLKNLKIIIGNNKLVENPNNIIDYYKYLVKNASSFKTFVGLVYNVKIAKFERTINKIRAVYVKQRDLIEEIIFRVNPYYARELNTLFVPLGALQSPIFDENWPISYNFGGFGTTIASLLFNGFDKVGSWYNEVGEKETYPNIEKSIFEDECFVKKNVSESIAKEIYAISLAYNASQLIILNLEKEIKIKEFSQKFFVGYANSKESADLINLPLKNSLEFRQIFNCTSGKNEMCLDKGICQLVN